MKKRRYTINPILFSINISIPILKYKYNRHVKNNNNDINYQII